ncbi:MAG: class I SAM-dependent methyltransferase, partial [Bacteroidetes bacterium]|nr:class I SAM-dependent methyltransferase [Bacteroidota bacterium]
MEKNSSSRTAEDMAGFRAMETLRPKEDRVCEDLFAKHFLTGPWAVRYKSPIRSKIFMWITHLINPGAVNTVSVRLRFIDDYIKTCIKDGFEQLVILGAGYDCRAYRMEELKNGVTVFEVDYPAIQNQKQHVLDRVLDKMPNHVVFVPYQLEEKGFGEQLLEQGYDKNKKSLFIMEGLIMYLAPEIVKELFSLISHHSCPGSSVIFDFLPPGIEDGSINNRGGKNMHKWAIKKGEPFKFGIDRNKLPQFLSEVGFDNVEAVAAEECRDKYFMGNNRKRSISPLFSFA